MLEAILILFPFRTEVSLCFSQEQVKKLRVHVEEVIKENERLHEEMAKIGSVHQKDW